MEILQQGREHAIREGLLKIAPGCEQTFNSACGKKETPTLKAESFAEEQKVSELKSKVDLRRKDSSGSSSNLSCDPVFTESLLSKKIDISPDMAKPKDSTNELDLIASENTGNVPPAILESPSNHENINEGHLKITLLKTQQSSNWISTREDLKPTKQTPQMCTSSYANSKYKRDDNVRTHVYATDSLGKSLDQNSSDVRTHVYGHINQNLSDVRTHVYGHINQNLSDVRTHVYGLINKINKFINLFNGGLKYLYHLMSDKKRSRINKSNVKWKQKKRNNGKLYNKFSAISENGAKSVKYVDKLVLSPDFLNAMHKTIIILIMKSDENSTLTMPETRRMKVRARGMKIIDIKEEKGLCEMEFLMEEHNTRNVLLLSAAQDQPIFNGYKTKTSSTHNPVGQPELTRVQNGGRNLTVLLTNIIVFLITLAMSMYPKLELWIKGHIPN